MGRCEESGFPLSLRDENASDSAVHQRENMILSSREYYITALIDILCEYIPILRFRSGSLRTILTLPPPTQCRPFLTNLDPVELLRAKLQ